MNALRSNETWDLEKCEIKNESYGSGTQYMQIVVILLYIFKAISEDWV